MALSKGLRLLRRLGAAGGGGVLLEARGRGDCLLFEAGTVAALGECLRPRGGGPGPGGRAPGGRGGKAPASPRWPVPGRAECARRGVGVGGGGFE